MFFILFLQHLFTSRFLISSPSICISFLNWIQISCNLFVLNLWIWIWILFN
jgi:hypothetical protein